MLQCSEEKHLKFEIMDNNKKQEMTNQASKLAKWFKIEITISIFGNQIIKWTYPPQKDE